jgi:hypothetical protein
MLGFQGGVSIPLVKGGVKAPPAKRQCRAGPKAGARRGFTTRATGGANRPIAYRGEGGHGVGACGAPQRPAREAAWLARGSRATEGEGITPQ